MTAFTPASRLAGLAPYLPPTRDPRIDLLLDLNEGEPPAAIIERWLGDFDRRSPSRYPDCSPLERQIAATFSVDPKSVVVTNGGDDAIDRACRATLEPGRTLLTHAPSFEMTSRSARLAGAEVREIEWWEGAFPLDRLTRAIDGSVSLIALTSPNNPTGAVIDADELLAFVRRSPCPVLVDLAYVEFAREDPTAALAREPNAIVVRTFSKAMGLASARVGYAIACPQIANWLRTAGGPFPVSGSSLALASLAWSHREAILSDIVPGVRAGRERIRSAIVEAGGMPLGSEANFIMARFDDAGRAVDAFAASGIAIRRFSKPELSSWTRITIPPREEAQQRVLRVLSEFAR